MRLGVSGKILLAFTFLLLAFAANATFTLVSIHRAGHGLVANEAYLELQGSVDAAWKALNDFAPSLGRTARLDPNLALAFRMAQKHLDDAVAAVDRYLQREPDSSRRPDFEAKRVQLVVLRKQLDGLAGRLGAAEVATDPKARPEFESQFATLTHALNRFRRPLRGESGRIAQRLSEDGETALQIAVLLGGAGLIIAVGVFLSIVGTLRPLRVLRARAREVAGGDYARRTGVRSRDEIGDLAREFDAMADAIQEREQRVIRSERLATVGHMASHIAHEVRNPLAAIGLNAELLGDEVSDKGEEPRRLVASIISEVDRLTEITETYLRFARLPQAKLEREDVGAIVRSATEFARPELQVAGVELETRIASDLPELLVDEGQLRQAVLNLVRNAREAMPGGGRVVVTCERAEAVEGVQLLISDTGAGIPPEHVGRIFDPFFSTKAKGTGLGLSLVQQIVAEHGGRIDVRSEPGRGTTFAIVLPAATGARRPAGQDERPAPDAAGDLPEVIG